VYNFRQPQWYTFDDGYSNILYDILTFSYIKLIQDAGTNAYSKIPKKNLTFSFKF